MKKNIQKLSKPLRSWLTRVFPKKPNISPPSKLEQPRSFGGQRLPRYVLIDEADVADRYFKRLQQSVHHHLIERRSADNSLFPAGQPIFWESGRITPGRHYFYLKPCNELGWLFERSGLGWVISRSEKIVGQDLFLRQSEPWDIVTLYEPANKDGYCRVSSLRRQGDLIGFAVYEKWILSQIGSDHLESASTLQSSELSDFGISL